MYPPPSPILGLNPRATGPVVCARPSAVVGRGFGRVLLLFVLLSGVDLFLTWRLVGRQGLAYEANPVAGWLLEHHGWVGLAAFKTGAVLGIGGLCTAVALRRPRAAVRVLVFACLVVTAVVTYSGALAAWAGAEPNTRDEMELRGVRQRGLALDARIERGWAYRALLTRLAADLAADRQSLSDAVGVLADSDELKGMDILQLLRSRFVNRPDMQCLAATLIEHALRSRADAVEALEIADRLEAEFLATYRVPAPPLSKPPLDAES